MTKKRRRPRWSQASINQLFELRDVQRKTWREIADFFDDMEANCAARYSYNLMKRRIEAMRTGRPVPARPHFRGPTRALHVAQPQPVAAPSTQEVADKVTTEDLPRRPQYFHEADADIAARIRRQGITAGFLGDPPPGRSALDQRGQ